MNPITELKLRLARAAIDLEPDLEIPRYRYDGEEFKSVEEVAAAMGIPVTEARLRLESKDVYSGLATHAVGMGVGTTPEDCGIVERAKRRRRRKKKKETEA